MTELYVLFVTSLVANAVLTGFLWGVCIVDPKSKIAPLKRGIRALHLGSLMMIPLFIGFDVWFDKWHVGAVHRAAFPVGLLLGTVLIFTAVGVPGDAGAGKYPFWGPGWPRRLTFLGLACISAGLLWSAAAITAKAIF